MPVHPSTHGQEAHTPQAPDEGKQPAGPAGCDCANVLNGLRKCRGALGGLSESECLAVLCTLSAEHGLTARRERPPGEAASAGLGALGAPDDLDWAREFVSQVVLSDALMGAAMRLDESKQQIDTIAARMDRVVGSASGQLEESEARYARLFERVKEGVFVCDAAGRFLDANPAALGLLGYGTKEALTGERTFGWLFADAASWEGFFVGLLEREHVQNAEYELVRRDGTHVHVLVTASLVRDAEGVVAGFSGIWVDVTERRRLHVRQIEAQRIEAARQMVVTYSHEINQPLAALCDHVQRLLECATPSGPVAEIALAMSEEAARLAEAMIKIGRLCQSGLRPLADEVAGTDA